MAHPTPRADALRQMREAKFEAEQKRLKQETGKPAEAPKRKAEPAAAATEKAAGKPAAAKKAPKVAKVTEATDVAAETVDNSLAAVPPEPDAAATTDQAAKKAAPKKAAKKAKAAAK